MERSGWKETANWSYLGSKWTMELLQDYQVEFAEGQENDGIDSITFTAIQTGSLA